MIITSLPLEVCLQINKLLGNNNPSDYPPRDSTNEATEGGHFSGTFSDNGFYEIDPAGMAGKLMGCYVNDTHAGASSAHDGTDYFYFYQVILAR
ncbi:MAG: hypothetical protein ACPG05_00860 [Bdellovibrionales bacterium]